MLPNTVSRNVFRRPVFAHGVVPKVGLRFKSEPSRHIDDFPYKHLDQRDVNHMSAEMESTGRLPLRSFFAQHRPLMPFARPVQPHQNINEDTTRWVHVPVNPGRPIFMSEDVGSGWNVIPENVAHQLGPFDREMMMNQKRTQSKAPSGISSSGMSPQSIYSGAPRSRSEPYSMNPTHVQSMLNKQFPILMQHLQKMANNDGEVHFIPLNLERSEQEQSYYDEGVDATSVQRKRKLKMNRHKYRKRLKEQRTKRRRLGK